MSPLQALSFGVRCMKPWYTLIMSSYKCRLELEAGAESDSKSVSSIILEGGSSTANRPKLKKPAKASEGLSGKVAPSPAGNGKVDGCRVHSNDRSIPTPPDEQEDDGVLRMSLNFFLHLAHYMSIVLRCLSLATRPVRFYLMIAFLALLRACGVACARFPPSFLDLTCHSRRHARSARNP